jgi:hypothetical protein
MNDLPEGALYKSGRVDRRIIVNNKVEDSETKFRRRRGPIPIS